MYIYIYKDISNIYLYICMYIYIYHFVYMKHASKYIYIHCGRLCKTTEIFVRNKNLFFYLIFTPTYLVILFLACNL